MEDQSIGDILNESEPETVAEQPEVQTEQPETVERPRGPDGKFIPRETGVETQQEAPVEPVPPTEQTSQLPPDVYEPLKAIRNENKELKQRLAEIERRTQPQYQPPQPQQPPADFWEDPQRFMAGFGEQLLGQWEQRQQVQRLNASEEAAKSKYADYDDAFQAFEQSVQLNPRLALELAQASDPGEFAYQRGKTALEIQRVGSIDDLKKQLRAEWEAEARAAIAPARVQLPSTTAADGSVGSRSGPAWSGPRPIGDILKP